MSVHRRRNGSWLVSIYHPNAPDGRLRKTCPGELGRREVEALERKLRRDLDDQAGGRGAEATLRDLFARYWREHGEHLASAASERGYLNAWADALGDGTAVTTVTPERISAAVARWRGSVSGSTINRRLSALQRIWRRAEDLWGHRLARVPWGRLRLPEPMPRDRSLSPDERRRLLDLLPDRSRAVVRFALLTGLRRGAILRLERKDLDLERGVINAVSKGRAGGRPTPVPISRAVASLLREISLPEVGRVFRISRQQLRDDWETARAAAGLPSVRFHDLRHTFAQDLEDAGAGDSITDALHHTDPKLRRRYSHVRQERLRGVLDRVFGTPEAHQPKKSNGNNG